MRSLVSDFMLLGVICSAWSRTHKVVVEFNAPGTLAFGHLLDNVENLYRALGSDGLQVEVVCHGSGVDMLTYGDAKFRKRLRLDQTRGIKFVACGNTLRGRHIRPDRLASGTRIVPSGVAEVVIRQEQGYAYLKGGN